MAPIIAPNVNIEPNKEYYIDNKNTQLILLNLLLILSCILLPLVLDFNKLINVPFSICTEKEKEASKAQLSTCLHTVLHMFILLSMFWFGY